MYHRLNVIRAGIWGIAFSLLIILEVILVSSWFGSATYPNASYVLMLIYTGSGVLVCFVIWIRGKPTLIYGGLHALV
jgi:hypothetical protein